MREAKKFKTTTWLKCSDARCNFWLSRSRYCLDLSPSVLMWLLYFSLASHQPHGPSEFCQHLCGLSLRSCFFFLFPFLYLLWFSHHIFFAPFSLWNKAFRVLFNRVFFFFQSAAQYLTIVLFLVLQVSSGNCLCSERSSKFLILWLFQPSQS